MTLDVAAIVDDGYSCRVRRCDETGAFCISGLAQTCDEAVARSGDLAARMIRNEPALLRSIIAYLNTGVVPQFAKLVQ